MAQGDYASGMSEAMFKALKPSGAWLGVSPADVACRMSEPFVRYRFPLVADDHRCPAKRFTARRTSTTEPMSSRLSRW